MTHDILAIHLSDISFESQFSMGEKVLNQSYNSLTPNAIEALICGKNWLMNNREGSLLFFKNNYLIF